MFVLVVQHKKTSTSLTLESQIIHLSICYLLNGFNFSSPFYFNKLKAAIWYRYICLHCSGFDDSTSKILILPTLFTNSKTLALTFLHEFLTFSKNAVFSSMKQSSKILGCLMGVLGLLLISSLTKDFALTTLMRNMFIHHALRILSYFAVM